MYKRQGKIEADVFHNAVIYMMISALSFPFLALYNSCAALFRSMGNSKITLKVSVVENIINIGGNALGVYVLGLGVAGVAIPSLISRAVAGFILYHLLKNPSNEVHLLKERFHIDWPVIHKIFYIGIPSGIENGIFQLGRVIVVSIIAGFGTVQIAANGVKYYIEVANMPTTNDALAFLMSQKHLTVAPSKAVNACGVSVSELEMAQNAQRIYWSAEEVDAKMESIMKNIYDASVEAAERYGLGYNLVAGANIAGFQKVADAMMAQGLV